MGDGLTLKEAEARALDLEDSVDDLLAGLRVWRAAKEFKDWSGADEALLRWVEHNHPGAWAS